MCLKILGVRCVNPFFENCSSEHNLITEKMPVCYSMNPIKKRNRKPLTIAVKKKIIQAVSEGKTPDDYWV